MPAPLGHEYVQAVIPTAGMANSGNWTATFTQSDINIGLAQFECYHIVIKGGPSGSTFDVVINDTNLYDSVQPGDTNSWDPNNPMKLSNGDTVSFRWNTGTGTTGPTVWMYFQEASAL